MSGRRPRLHLLATALVALAALASPLLARAQSDETGSVATAPAPADVAYEVRITGDFDSNLSDLLRRSSQLVTLSDRPPISEGALIRRAEDDLERFRAVLRSEGFYDGEVTYRIDRNSAGDTVVVVSVRLGPPFKLAHYEIVDVGHSALPASVPPLKALGLEIGQRARAPEIVGAQKRLLRLLAEQSYPLARIVDQDAVVDFADDTMRVTLDVDPGPAVNFGKTTIEGASAVEVEYIRSLIPWRPGQPFDQLKVDDFRRKLVATGLFATVIVSHADAPDDANRLAMTIEVVEGKHRSVGLGGKYYTSEGPAIEAFWEHRNLFNRNEKLRLTLELGFILQQLTTDFVVPNFRRPDQELFNEVKLTRQRAEGWGGFISHSGAAFSQDGVSATSGVRRRLTPAITGELGVSLDAARLKEIDESTQTSTLLGAPAALTYDDTGQPLDPRKGVRARYAPTPYVGWYDRTVSFLVNEVSVSGYVPLDAEQRFVLAARGGVGAIIGPTRDDIPTDKRFYAGGGESIRGYPFQTAGPLDNDDNPLGGRSLLLLSAEARARVWGNFGLVPFIDAGNVYTSTFPDLSESLLVGAGLGFRYHTPIGPVRLDIATPLTPRKSVDDPVQFYISIGQSF